VSIPIASTFVGFSFGGHLAALMGVLHPDEVRALVIYYAITSHSPLRGPILPSAAKAIAIDFPARNLK